MAVGKNVLQVISNIEQGKKNVPGQIRWENLNSEERDYLLEQAQNRWPDDNKGIELLNAIYDISVNDTPNRIKLFQLLYVRRDTNADKKKQILGKLEKLLGILRNNGKAQQYNLYYGDYHLLLAGDIKDSGNIERALLEYQSAIEFYEKAGEKERIREIEGEISNIKSLMEQSIKPLPIEILFSQKNQLEADLAQTRKQFMELNSQLQQAKIELSEIEKKRVLEEKSRKKIHVEIVTLQSEIEQLNKQYPSARAIFEFMVALPKAAVAPLWVEVLHLALQQGEMDEFSIQALERLAIPHPDEAIPLLAEIAARAPEPFGVEPQKAQIGITQWFLLIAKARQEILEKEHLKAADTLVKAWETFFTLQTNK